PRVDGHAPKGLATGSRRPRGDGRAGGRVGHVAPTGGPQPLDDPPAREGSRSDERLRLRSPAAQRAEAASRAHVQGEPRPRLRGEGARYRGPLPQSSRARGGPQRRREDVDPSVGTDPTAPATAIWPRRAPHARLQTP